MTSFEWVVPILLTLMTAATPILFAAIGELVVERAGVLNLGVEGMLLLGAVFAFAAGSTFGSGVVAVLAGAFAGMSLALVFGILTLTLRANQVATGLALTIFGTGFSSLVGSGFVGYAIPPIERLAIPGLSSLPGVGQILFGHDPLVYTSLVLVPIISLFLYRSRPGLILRAVGESHHSAHALGYSVLKIRYFAVLFGGAMAGIGGAYLSLVYTPLWAENMTAGRGWIALALVVFATWRPGRLLLGAYLFGGITILQLHAQGIGIGIPSQFMSMLPYLATIFVLILISGDRVRSQLGAPSSLGHVFHRTF